MKNSFEKELSIAPMMKWTDSYCRFFHRQFSKNFLLYTEMLPANAIVYGNKGKLLRFDTAEHPVAVQIGGSDPEILSKAAKICEEFGYDEINLNVGCPSPKVKKGRFGACLMFEPSLVKDCLQAMIKATKIPISVKCRIGVDEMDEISGLDEFIDTIIETKISKVIIHARKAYLKGLNPKQNRDVPPLNYERVRLLKERLNNQIKIIVNGGINSVEKAENLLEWADGVMIGREAYKSPLFIRLLDNYFLRRDEDLSQIRVEVVKKTIKYIKSCRIKNPNFKLNHMTRHMLGLYGGLHGARLFRQKLNEIAFQNQDPSEISDIVEKIEQLILLRNKLAA